MKQRKAVMVSQRKSYEKRLQHFNQEQKKVEGMVNGASDAANFEIKARSVSFIGCIQLLERRQTEVEQEITARKTTVQKLQENLEQELSELKRQRAELDSLSLTGDPGQFLQKCEHLSELRDQPQSSSAEELPGFTDITEALCDLTDKLQTCTNMGLALTQNKLLLQQPTTREQYLQYAINITLDPNTAHKQLVLSGENRRITLVKEEQDYPDHPDRFRGVEMVLSSQELTGRCYFEVQWIKPPGFLGMTYKSIGRKGRGSVLGMSDISWALSIHGNDVSLWHNGQKLEVMNPPFERVSRMGVFLDLTAGNVSFFGISRDEMFQFAKVQTLFHYPLFVAVRFTGGEDSFEFLKLK
uniref:B30.2/SPRY domain-containing protein n=1 Tax=Neogobius melanostomus TaxID=47308 RepID=A0A8C6SPA3_9GOBI